MVAPPVMIGCMVDWCVSGQSTKAPSNKADVFKHLEMHHCISNIQYKARQIVQRRPSIMITYHKWWMVGQKNRQCVKNIQHEMLSIPPERQLLSSNPIGNDNCFRMGKQGRFLMRNNHISIVGNLPFFLMRNQGRTVMDIPKKYRCRQIQFQKVSQLRILGFQQTFRL